jgi:hypothetical protein
MKDEKGVFVSLNIYLKFVDKWIFIANDIYDIMPGSNEGMGKLNEFTI